MKYTIHLTEEDYIRFTIFFNKHSKNGLRQMRYARMMVLALAALNFFLSFSSGGIDYLLMVPSVILLLLFIAFPKINEMGMRITIAALKKGGKLPFPPVSEIEFQDSMIVQDYEQGQLRIKYKDIENIYFENNYIYIIFSAMQGIIIPFQSLGNDKEQVIAHIMERMHEP